MNVIKNVMAAPKRKPKGWHPSKIKMEVQMKGKTLSDLGRDRGYDESICRAALIRSCPMGESIISAFLNVPLHVLWPDRYEPHNKRRPRHVRDETKRNRSAPHRQIEGAR